MTNFKKYFAYHLRSGLKTLVYILVAVLVLTFIMASNGQPSSNGIFRSTIYIPIIFLCIMMYVLPVSEFSFFKKRTNLDCAYSLPISRRAMGIVHYLTGMISLFTVYTASYLVNFIMALSRGPGLFNFAAMACHYFFCLILGIAVYTLMAFVFNEGNTKGDGIWFMVLYTFVFLLIHSALTFFIYKINVLGDLDAVPWISISIITDYFTRLVEIKSIPPYEVASIELYFKWAIFWIAIGIASAVGLFLTFGKRRMEKTEEISNSFFGYRVLIPLYAVTGMISFGVWDGKVILWVIIELFALLGYTIYRRGFHYKKSDIAILLLLFIFLFI